MIFCISIVPPAIPQPHASLNLLDPWPSRHIVNNQALKKISQETMLINTARGQIINLDDLYHAIKNNLISGAALDVLPSEPPDISHPLIVLQRNVLIQHIFLWTHIFPLTIFWDPDFFPY